MWCTLHPHLLDSHQPRLPLRDDDTNVKRRRAPVRVRTKRAPPSWRGSRRPASEPAAAVREALRAARRGYRSLKRLARRKVTRFVLGWRVSTQLGNELRGGAKVVDARDALARVERPGVEQDVRSGDPRGRGGG